MTTETITTENLRRTASGAALLAEMQHVESRDRARSEAVDRIACERAKIVDLLAERARVLTHHSKLCEKAERALKDSQRARQHELRPIDEDLAHANGSIAAAERELRRSAPRDLLDAFQREMRAKADAARDRFASWQSESRDAGGDRIITHASNAGEVERVAAVCLAAVRDVPRIEMLADDGEIAAALTEWRQRVDAAERGTAE